MTRDDLVGEDPPQNEVRGGEDHDRRHDDEEIDLVQRVEVHATLLPYATTLTVRCCLRA